MCSMALYLTLAVQSKRVLTEIWQNSNNSYNTVLKNGLQRPLNTYTHCDSQSDTSHTVPLLCRSLSLPSPCSLMTVFLSVLERTISSQRYLLQMMFLGDRWWTPQLLCRQKEEPPLHGLQNNLWDLLLQDVVKTARLGGFKWDFTNTPETLWLVGTIFLLLY